MAQQDKTPKPGAVLDAAASQMQYTPEQVQLALAALQAAGAKPATQEQANKAGAKVELDVNAVPTQFRGALADIVEGAGDKKTAMLLRGTPMPDSRWSEIKQLGGVNVKLRHVAYFIVGGVAVFLAYEYFIAPQMGWKQILDHKRSR